ncbi:DJ-1/PfpI family protein [bacterium]|nr:DJ-1/PfpI family protein [bacterium]
MKRACVLLAEGFEEVEALTPIDYLRRGGVEVVTLGLGGLKVRGARSVEVSADATLEGAAAAGESFDAVVIPGGMPGARNLAESRAARDLILRHSREGKIVAAICAAPAVVLHEACGLLAGRRYTCFPGMERRVAGAIHSAERVVVDGKLITSRAAGTAGEFAVAILGALAGKDQAEAIAESVLLLR